MTIGSGIAVIGIWVSVAACAYLLGPSLSICCVVFFAALTSSRCAS